MTLLTRIKADALTARKTQSPTAGVLTTLLGEADTKAKTFNPARELKDDEVIAIVQKFIKNIDQTLRSLEGGPNVAARDKARMERGALEAYLPLQLTELAITEFAKAEIAKGANFGAVMSALKANYAGQYDGKMASEVIKRLMAA